MKNKSIFIIIFLLIFLLSVFLKVRSYDFSIQKQNSENTEERHDYISKDEMYYINLEKACDNNCCLASVEKMRISNAIKAENEKCESGYDINRLLCIGSYSWCNKQTIQNDIKKEISLDKKIENYLSTQKKFSLELGNKNSEVCSFINLNNTRDTLFSEDLFPFPALVSCIEYSQKEGQVIKINETNNIPTIFELIEDLKTGKLNKITHKIFRDDLYYEKDFKNVFSEENMKKMEEKEILNMLKQKIDKRFENISLGDFDKGNWKIYREEDGKIKSKIVRSSYLDDVKNAQDSRQYQYGINFLNKSNRDYMLIWSSSGNAIYPKVIDDEWNHNTYYSLIDSSNPEIISRKLIGTPSTQGFVSSAVNNDGNIFVTVEDVHKTYNEVSQSYVVFDKKMRKIKPYYKTVFDGGHSGHVSAAEDKFSVFYSDGWVEGGGINQLGTGDDVRMSIYDSSGELLDEISVVAGNETRDWWPLIASSKNKNFLLWQRFIDGEHFAMLMFAIYNLDTNSFDKKVSILKDNVKFYTYNVEYLESIDRFLVLGKSSDNKGFGILLSSDGNIVAESYNLTPIIRGAKPAIKSLNKNEVKVAYPAFSNDVAMLSVVSNNITAEGVVSVGYDWDISGTDGIFLDNNDLYFASLSAEGLKELQIKIYEKLDY